MKLASVRWRYGFLLSGAFCLGWYGYTYADREFYQARQSWLFDHERVSGEPSPVTVLGHETVKLPGAPLHSMIGRLSLPRLNLSMMVREGVDDGTLQKAVGHIPTTALPGQTGNVGLAGHRDTFFRDLRHVKAGDQIQFLTPDRRFDYEVESVAVVSPDAIGVLAGSQDKSLTLVTCYPFYYVGNAPDRFIVRARQVSDMSR